MKKCVLVTGAQGLVGSRFAELYGQRNNLLTPQISEFNFLDIPLMEKYLKDKNITHVVNFAAFTDVSLGESERGNKNGLCWRVNVTGVQNLTKMFNKNKVKFIHISTDMVFPGSSEDRGPYDEKHKPIDDPNVVTWYGYSKYEGEKVVQNYFRNPAIVRIIYPVRARFDLKSDFLRKPLKLYEEGKLYPLFDDQHLSITFIDELYKVLKVIIEDEKSGIFHCSSDDQTTPHEIVSYLIEAKYGVKGVVKRASIKDFLKTQENPRRYPIFGGLRSTYSQQALQIKFSGWKEIVNELLKQNITP